MPVSAEPPRTGYVCITITAAPSIVAVCATPWTYILGAELQAVVVQFPDIRSRTTSVTLSTMNVVVVDRGISRGNRSGGGKGVGFDRNDPAPLRPFAAGRHPWCAVVRGPR